MSWEAVTALASLAVALVAIIGGATSYGVLVGRFAALKEDVERHGTEISTLRAEIVGGFERVTNRIDKMFSPAK